MTAPHENSRRSLFAVWRWSLSTWVKIAVLLPIVYFVSAVPVCVVIDEMVYSGNDDGKSRMHERMASGLAEAFYEPVWWSERKSKRIKLILAWERELAVWMIKGLGIP